VCAGEHELVLHLCGFLTTFADVNFYFSMCYVILLEVNVILFILEFTFVLNCLLYVKSLF
jgi:hypothetical protein